MGFVGPALILGAAAALILLERRRPLRRASEDPDRRDLRNLAIAAAAAATVRLVEQSIVEPLAALAVRRRWGLLNRVRLPRWARLGLGLALMDYTLYLWHVLTHKVPLLWRFHRVHHADRDLSATTALRFHFGELALSVPWRALQVLLIGVAPRELKLWQQATLVSILFHHANLGLPRAIDRWLARYVVTPRMHGIHHSIVEPEMNSNWSSGLTLWDRMHGTLRLDVPQRAITIGVPGLRHPAQLTLRNALALPFRSPAPAPRPRASRD